MKISCTYSGLDGSDAFKERKLKGEIRALFQDLMGQISF